MIVTVYTPNGIVVATASSDLFYEYQESEDGTMLSPLHIEGLPHTYTFCGKFSLTYNNINSYAIETNLLKEFDKLSNSWTSTPKITEFMPYLKKLLMDNQIQIIGIVAAYDTEKDGTIVPYVYQILGENINRINLNDEGQINYNCVYLEKKTHIGKLFQQTQIKNGDAWEEVNAIRLRCDLYSIRKSIDLCRFILRTDHYVENINSIMYDMPLKADMTVVTQNKIENQIIDI